VARLPSTSKEPPRRPDAFGHVLETFGVLAHRGAVYRRSRPAPPYAPVVGDLARFEAVLEQASEAGAALVTEDERPVVVAFLDGPGDVPAVVNGSGGGTIHADATSVLARFDEPAGVIDAWLALAEASQGRARGGAALGLVHRDDLARATATEAAALGDHSTPGTLWISFDLAMTVPLGGGRYAVEKVDQDSLVQSCFRLTYRA
jgi:hypothetical protein